jgi:hypothetical protein
MEPHIHLKHLRHNKVKNVLDRFDANYRVKCSDLLIRTLLISLS